MDVINDIEEVPETALEELSNGDEEVDENVEQ